MNGLTLKLRADIAGQLDLYGIVPDQLCGLDVPSISQIMIKHDATPVPLGSYFTIVEGDRERLILAGNFSQCDRIGGGMRSGSMHIFGDVGHRLADRMRGGHLQLAGSAGDYACANQLGGLVEIAGDVGDYCAAAAPSHRRGMRGGVCVVRGNAGRFAAGRMRRGTLIVQGKVDLGCASALVAGTILILGKVTPPWGVGMRRGTIVVAGDPAPPLHSGFTPLERVRLAFLPMLLSEFQRYLPETYTVRLKSNQVFRALGDRASGGLGELLWISASPDPQTDLV